jgi:dethiobiotin synthetase
VNFFLTGTDTNVGKTYVAARLVKALRNAGRSCVGFKPICCGPRDDAEALHAASGGAVSLNDVNPVWLRAPVSPYAASMIENRMIDLALIHETFARLRSAHESIIVEGVGGWLAPIARDYFVRELAVDFKLPVIVVIANRLGALNHTMLTVESIRVSGLECAGVILNHVFPPDDDAQSAVLTNAFVIGEMLESPILFEVGYGQENLTLPWKEPRVSDPAG